MFRRQSATCLHRNPQAGLKRKESQLHRLQPALLISDKGCWLQCSSCCIGIKDYCRNALWHHNLPTDLPRATLLVHQTLPLGMHFSHHTNRKVFPFGLALKGKLVGWFTSRHLIDPEPLDSGLHNMAESFHWSTLPFSPSESLACVSQYPLHLRCTYIETPSNTTYTDHLPLIWSARGSDTSIVKIFQSVSPTEKHATQLEPVTVIRQYLHQ